MPLSCWKCLGPSAPAAVQQHALLPTEDTVNMDDIEKAPGQEPPSETKGGCCERCLRCCSVTCVAGGLGALLVLAGLAAVVYYLATRPLPAPGPVPFVTMPKLGPKVSLGLGGPTPRIVLVSRGSQQVFVLQDETEVVLMGANYVVKGSPWFPPLDVVRRNAAQINATAHQMAFRPSKDANGKPRVVKPFVRLGAMWAAYMPDVSGQVDLKFVADLEATVQAFQEAGVYVALELHQDAMAPTNGGEGIPAWVAIQMQKEDPSRSYVVSPSRPLQYSSFSGVNNILKAFNTSIQQLAQRQPFKTVPKDPNPWGPYSPGSNSGPPSKMNVGNPSMLLNNHDSAWGSLGYSAQVQSVGGRFFLSAQKPGSSDYKSYFLPYVQYILYLASVWQRHSNVVAVELLNEPTFFDTDDLDEAPLMRRRLFHFYAEVMKQLDQAIQPDSQPPLAIEDIGGGVLGYSFPSNVLFLTPDAAPFRQRAARGQLIFSWHWYPRYLPAQRLEREQLYASSFANFLGGTPVWLSEFFDWDAQTIANTMALAVNSGCNAVTWWHYVDSNFTGGQEAWVIFPAGPPYDGRTDSINMSAFAAWNASVWNGSSFGAAITGAYGGEQNVLALVPATAANFA